MLLAFFFFFLVFFPSLKIEIDKDSDESIGFNVELEEETGVEGVISYVYVMKPTARAVPTQQSNLSTLSFYQMLCLVGLHPTLVAV